MPVSIQRLNQRGRRHPNDRIIFIKALPGPTQATAEDFLMRVAAICKPLMEQHTLSVMTLEEVVPNNEFVGRNYNAGECVQLVLRSRSNPGNWLPMSFVQMVMMHELAHCKQMNHSRAFWAVRNEYASDLRALWARGYKGDGLWGSGRALYNGQPADDAAPDAADLAEHLCGGTFRSRGRKRKRGGKSEGKQLSYAERKQRRIERKFGVNGQALGADEDRRTVLERGKGGVSKPRVAQSKRGRELRAQAALMRFQQQQDSNQTERVKSEELSSSAEDDEFSEWEDGDAEAEDAVDADGKRLLDEKGRSMVRVCGDEDYAADPEARNELSELTQAGQAPPGPAKSTEKSTGTKDSSKRGKKRKIPIVDLEETSQDEQAGARDMAPLEFSRPNNASLTKAKMPRADTEASQMPAKPTESALASTPVQISDTHATINIADEEESCAVCSMLNPPGQLTCIACAHVLSTDRLPRYWRCPSTACKSSAYINSADAGRCGICGLAQPSV